MTFNMKRRWGSSSKSKWGQRWGVKRNRLKRVCIGKERKRAKDSNR